MRFINPTRGFRSGPMSLSNNVLHSKEEKAPSWMRLSRQEHCRIGPESEGLKLNELG